MNRTLQILHLEDDPDFAELVRSLFAQDGLGVEVKMCWRPRGVSGRIGY